MRTLAIALGACALALVCAPQAHAQQLAEGGAEIWDLSDSASPRHWFTGFRCWDSADAARFDGRTAFEPVGGDVACNYTSEQVYVTLYATLRRPLGTTFDSVVQATRQEVRARYQGAEVVSDTQREIDTPAGAVTVDELIFAVRGQDMNTRRDMRGVTGVWHIDVGDWTLKLRLSNYAGGDRDWARRTADAILARAFSEMDVARACVDAGAAPAPNPTLSDEEAINLDVAAAIMIPMLQGVVPADPVAARAAGYVCLGETLQSRTGALVTAVMTRPGLADSAALATTLDAAMHVVALGEIRDGATPATMVAIVQSSMNPFGVEGVRADAAQLAFSFRPDAQTFLGTVSSPPRQAGAQAAAYVANGGAARVTVTRGPATSDQSQPN